MEKNQNTSCQRGERGRMGQGLTGKGHEETFRDNGIILYVDGGLHYRLCKCQNSLDSISLMQIFSESKQTLNSS